MSEILAPAIHYARNGFPVSELIAYYWERNSTSLKQFPGFEEIFMPGGSAPKKGEIFRNPYLAQTLELIARQGRDVFYKGEIAEKIVKYVREQGGFLSLKDFEDHRSEWVEPLSASYRGYDVWELPPNGQGTAALQMLNILENFDIAGMGFGSPEYMHLFIEAKKLAFEDRAKYYADPAFNQLPLAELTSKEYAKKQAALIDQNRAARSYPAWGMEHGNTIYLTTADRFGCPLLRRPGAVQNKRIAPGPELCPGHHEIHENRCDPDGKRLGRNHAARWRDARHPQG